MQYSVTDNGLNCDCYNFDVCPSIKVSIFPTLLEASIHALKWLYGFNYEEAESCISVISIELDQKIGMSDVIIRCDSSNKKEVAFGELDKFGSRV